MLLTVKGGEMIKHKLIGRKNVVIHTFHNGFTWNNIYC